ncbi:MAG: non-homologous end-joining DNA ligase [Candidatus Binatia bacterium]
MRRASAPYAAELATLVKSAPEGDEWLHEVKFDGYRIGAVIERGAVRLFSRRGNDWTARFRDVAEAVRALGLRRGVIDGEVAAVLADGRTSFQALQNWSRADGRTRLAYFAFDLLRRDARDLSSSPLEERKKELRDLLAGAAGTSLLHFSDHVVGDGARVHRQACRIGLEGIVSKLRAAPYRAGRTLDWRKKRRAPREPSRGKQKQSEAASVAGVRITHPERVLYPEAGITKLELARFYESIARWILPHLRGRPLTLVRCPEGVADECFYMKHSKLWAPPALRRVQIREKHKTGDYLIAEDVAGLVSLVQMDVLEIHTWNSTFDRLEQPDRMVFDLDPGPEVPWPQVIEAARLVRDVLETLGLASFVKTTGGKGLHVVVPLAPARDWDECFAFSRGVAERIAAEEPTRYTTNVRKKGRERKILIDYYRNNRTNTSVAAFSTRARGRAPVSVPVDWSELSPRLHSDAYDVKTLGRRLARRRKDPWAAAARLRQKISASAMKAVVSASRSR